jgi:hypothetical protein
MWVRSTRWSPVWSSRRCCVRRCTLAASDRGPAHVVRNDPTARIDGEHLPDDPAGLELRAHDTEPADDHDRTGEHIQHTDTRWSLELDNPYLWLR